MLFRFQIEFSDIDRGVYESLDFRLSQHPSETTPYLLTRALAYCLSYQSGLEFSPKGLGDPDAPALQVTGANGGIDLWIDIGNPSPKRLHKANKASSQVVVYTYKSADLLIADIKANDVHKASDIHIYAFEPKFLNALEERLEKNNRWSILVQESQMNVEFGDHSFVAQLKRQSP